MAANAIIKFLNAARSLVNQGMSKEAVMNFAKNEFGEINELFQKQIDSIFKPGQGIKSIKMKDPDFDDTVIKMQFDEQNIPYNPNNPLKYYGKPKQPTKEITEDTGEGFIDFVRRTDPEGADKLQKVEDEIKAAIEAADKRVAEKLKKKNKKIKEDDPEFYTGGMVEVEPSLSDIGHGADALMARTRLVSPGNQATTSTGLNYLLAEDNDNLRVPFSKGKIAKEVLDKGRRGFMKAAGAAGAGIAALKTGLLGFGEKAAPVVETAVETVKQTAKGVPPYFFRLVEKIREMGDDTLATQDKTIAKKYKDYVMEEDFAGNITIVKSGEDLQGNKLEDVYMSYKVDDVALKDKDGFAKAEEYEEFTARPDMEGKMKDVEPGVPDEVIEEAGDIDAMTLKKADGGRIGFNKGKLAVEGGRRLVEEGRRFLEKVFGKEKFQTMIDNDPELEQGMLEVVDMFRKKDKEGLKMYLQKFLPKMGDSEIEEFIIGSDGTEGIQGQLIRLGSGRDYKGKIEMIEEADRVRKLEDFDIEGVSKNAEGGRIPYFKGGIAALKTILNYFAEQAGKKGSDQLKDINPKVLPSGIENIMGPEHMKMLKENQTGYLESLLTIMKSDKQFVDNVNKRVQDMKKNAPEGFEDVSENIGKQMVRSFMKDNPKFNRLKVYDKINIDDAIVDVEQMIKNRRVKESDGRALNASGGLQAMLGE